MKLHGRKVADGKWMHIAAHVKTRNSMQCRDRWVNKLHPNVNFAPWRPQDDKVMYDYIKAFIQKYGSEAKTRCEYYHWFLTLQFCAGLQIYCIIYTFILTFINVLEIHVRPVITSYKTSLEGLKNGMKALAHYNCNRKKSSYCPYTPQLFFTTATIISTVSYMDNDF